jgi:hypothetical protein
MNIRNALNGENENPKVTRNKIINALLEDPNPLLGLESSSAILKQEFASEKTDLHLPTVTFIEPFVKGDLQSMIWCDRIWPLFWHLSKWDIAHFAVFSSVDGEAGCAVTTFFSCYSHDKQGQSATIKVVKQSKLESSRMNS